MQVPAMIRSVSTTRALKQMEMNVTQATLKVVTTPRELLEAVYAGIPHIEIRDHLDLTTVTPLYPGTPRTLLGAFEAPLSDLGRSIQVRVY